MLLLGFINIGITPVQAALLIQFIQKSCLKLLDWGEQKTVKEIGKVGIKRHNSGGSVRAGTS